MYLCELCGVPEFRISGQYAAVEMMVVMLIHKYQSISVRTVITIGSRTENNERFHYYEAR